MRGYVWIGAGSVWKLKSQKLPILVHPNLCSCRRIYSRALEIRRHSLKEWPLNDTSNFMSDGIAAEKAVAGRSMFFMNNKTLQLQHQIAALQGCRVPVQVAHWPS